tara:strand:- start:2452 stop:2622 length:171 start_codon:yes stop_codon:yes gene_type:complete
MLDYRLFGEILRNGLTSQYVENVLTNMEVDNDTQQSNVEEGRGKFTYMFISTLSSF